jgi:hypothetical protein
MPALNNPKSATATIELILTLLYVPALITAACKKCVGFRMTT